MLVTLLRIYLGICWISFVNKATSNSSKTTNSTRRTRQCCHYRVWLSSQSECVLSLIYFRLFYKYIFTTRDPSSEGWVVVKWFLRNRQLWLHHLYITFFSVSESFFPISMEKHGFRDKYIFNLSHNGKRLRKRSKDYGKTEKQGERNSADKKKRRL